VLPQTKGEELYIYIISVDLVVIAEKNMEFGVGPSRVASMLLASGQHN
jgi:predicted metal-binding membrane protein